MSIVNKFNDISTSREIVLDIETTGLLTADGHRLVEVAAVEMINGRPSGVEFHALVNPGRDIPDEVAKIHGITDEHVKDQPGFAAIAQQLRDFIGSSTIVITCRTMQDGYTLDQAFLNMEFEKANLPIIPEMQWLNVRRWSEEMFGEKCATLDKVLDRYGVSRKERDTKGHAALLDARLLSEIYPRLEKDYRAAKNTGSAPSANTPSP